MKNQWQQFLRYIHNGTIQHENFYIKMTEYIIMQKVIDSCFFCMTE